jgi:hypothetical protein
MRTFGLSKVMFLDFNIMINSPSELGSEICEYRCSAGILVYFGVSGNRKLQ